MHIASSLPPDRTLHLLQTPDRSFATDKRADASLTRSCCGGYINKFLDKDVL